MINVDTDEIVRSELMDYMCISAKYKARVLDVNVLRDPGDVQSDHHLVVCKVKVKGDRFLSSRK